MLVYDESYDEAGPQAHSGAPRGDTAPSQHCLWSQPRDTAARKPAPKGDTPLWLPASRSGESTSEDFSSCKARLSNPRQGPRTRGYRRPASHQRLANRRYWNLLPNSPAEPVFLGRGPSGTGAGMGLCHHGVHLCVLWSSLVVRLVVHQHSVFIALLGCPTGLA